MPRKSILSILYSRSSTCFTLKVQSSQVLPYIATQVYNEDHCNVHCGIYLNARMGCQVAFVPYGAQ